MESTKPINSDLNTEIIFLGVTEFPNCGKH